MSTKIYVDFDGILLAVLLLLLFESRSLRLYTELVRRLNIPVCNG